MKKIFYLWLIGIFCLSTATFAQEKNKGLSKEERKQAEKELGIRLFNEAKNAIENQSFVLEAYRLVFKYGRSEYVTSSTNFVSVNDDRATIQIALMGSRRSGPNGLGGITVEGSPSNYKISYDKKGNLTLSMAVQGVGISAQVFIRMLYGSNNASIDVNPNFNSNRLTLDGVIIPFEDSKVFKGRTL